MNKDLLSRLRGRIQFRTYRVFIPFTSMAKDCTSSSITHFICPFLTCEHVNITLVTFVLGLCINCNQQMINPLKLNFWNRMGLY